MLHVIIILSLLHFSLGLKCPLKCECQGVLVDCSYKGFSSIPKNIPKNTQVLLVFYFTLLIFVLLCCVTLKISILLGFSEFQKFKF